MSGLTNELDDAAWEWKEAVANDEQVSADLARFKDDVDPAHHQALGELLDRKAQSDGRLRAAFQRLCAATGSG